MKTNKNNAHNRHGFSMIEMMIGITVLLIVLLGVSGVLARNQRLWNGMYNRIYSDVFTNGQVAKKIFDSIRLQQAVRLLGVSLSNLIKTPQQLPLFLDKMQQQEVTRAMDAVNNRFGDFTLTWASLYFLDEHSGIISPAWRPIGTRKIEF